MPALIGLRAAAVVADAFDAAADATADAAADAAADAVADADADAVADADADADADAAALTLSIRSPHVWLKAIENGAKAQKAGAPLLQQQAY